MDKFVIKRKASELDRHITRKCGNPTDSEKMQVFWLNFNLA